MKRLIICAGVASVLSTAMAVNNANLKPSFADLTWYSNKQAVKVQMLKKGYIFEREVNSSGATDVRYSGKIQGMPATILNYFDNKNQLVKTSIVFEKGYNSSLYRNWSSLKDSIAAKYGAGIDLSTISKGRSYEYDFQLESELNSNKILSYGWVFSTYNYAISLDVDQPFINDDDYFVTLAYESPAWGKELKRRQSAGDL